MARSPRVLNAPNAVSTPSTTSAPTTRTRAKPSPITSLTPSTPTPASATPDNGTPVHPKTVVEAKTHGLRSVLGEKERAPCPFPGEYGGREKLGVSEEDERDEVLMAVCAACARLDNRALSAEEIAGIAIEEGWLRPPSAAVAPSTIINNAIRAHQKRAATAEPSRSCLLSKHQLSGSVNESVLEPAFHPTAFNGLTRPKGSFWFLANVGKVKWKNPFAGLDIPQMPIRKPGPPKRVTDKPKTKAQTTKTSSKPQVLKSKAKTGPTASAPPKVRLIFRPQATDADDGASEAGSSSLGSRGVSRRNSDSAPGPSVSPVITARQSAAYRAPIGLDSSDESDGSDSEPENMVSRAMPIRIKRDRPVPLSLNSSRITIPPHVSRSLGSPFLDWGHSVLPDSPALSTGILPPSNISPFPSHSLDNTTWGVRRDRFASLETSSSSSDDEMRDSVDWGNASSILIRSVDEADDVKPMWSTEDEDSKVKEATDALRVLFPMSGPEDDPRLDERVHLNQLDNRPAPSDTSSIADTVSTNTISRGPLKSADLAASIALSSWNITSSPIASPNLRANQQLPVDASPTQHLSKLKHSFDSDDMDVDEIWPDGELPVRAEDVSSDVELDADLMSNVGDILSPDEDRQLHTAAWAREAAVSGTFRIKDEAADYPSPMTTESDEVSQIDYRASRASSQESHTPSSGLSDLPYELDHERLITRDDIETILDGPESVSIDELDACFVGKGRADKTPQRNRTKGKTGKDKNDGSRCSGIWGGIGVGTLHGLPTPNKTTPPSTGRPRGGRAVVRRRSSVKTPAGSRTTVDSLPTPPADIDLPHIKISPSDLDFDPIGPAELEAACAEAEAREERHRKACREKEEKQKAFLEAYRQKVKEAQIAGQSSETASPEGREGPSPWSDGTAWGATDSNGLRTPSALSPMALHMSALSLDTPMYHSVDPKALISPPLLASGQMAVDEAITPVEPMQSGNQINGRSQPIPIAAAPAVGTPTPQRAAQPASKLLPIAIKKETPAGHGTDSPKTLPTLAPALPRPTSASGSNASPTVANKSVPVKAPGSAQTTQPTASNAERTRKVPSPSNSGSSTPNSEVKKDSRWTTTKYLAPGVDACVIDSIPVYAHMRDGKHGKFTLLRRLDTDFINATTLLQAFGIPLQKHGEWLSSVPHHGVGPICPSSKEPFSEGVPGLWVSYDTGLELVRKLNIKPEDKGHLDNFLKSDLFTTFAALAGIKGVHTSGLKFGTSFRIVYESSMPAGQSPSQASSQAASQSSQQTSQAATPTGSQSAAQRSAPPAQPIPRPAPNGSLTASSLNSKSAPDLPSLSTSVPLAARARQTETPGQAKGALVRPAPPAQLEGCPQPKRRRATMSLGGDIHGLTKIAPAPPHALSGSTMGAAGVKKAPVRATRASIAGDVPKPKMTR